LSFSRSPLPCEDHAYDQGPNITRHEHRDIERERGAEFNPPNPQNELRGHDPDHGIDCSFAVQELASGPGCELQGRPENSSQATE
jgi:hypothetical protein